MTQWTETENWLIPHFIHHILVNFVLCEQFTDNLLMAKPTSQQEAVQATLKEGWQTRHYLTSFTTLWYHSITLVQKHTTERRQTDWTQYVQKNAYILVQMSFPHGITC